MTPDDQQLLDLAALNEQRCRKVAHILGASSAAQQALNKAESARAAGRAAAIVLSGESWVVVEAAKKPQRKGEP